MNPVHFFLGQRHVAERSLGSTKGAQALGGTVTANCVNGVPWWWEVVWPAKLQQLLWQLSS